MPLAVGSVRLAVPRLSYGETYLYEDEGIYGGPWKQV